MRIKLNIFVAMLLLTATNIYASGNFSVPQAEQSITVADIKEHVKVLASDTFEGREAGSRGGQAVGVYLGQQYQTFKLAGGASEKNYYQTFHGNCRNILGLLRGSDPKLRDEVILIGAHYDHVGYGTAENSRGAVGYIHNGADDNASGAAGLVEIAQAICRLETAPKRTILFALWDGEEKGLLGSKHWLSAPTIPLNRVKMVINVDMIGRLRKNTLTCFGSRTCRGLRRLVSGHNNSETLKLNYTWKLPENSDHWPFVQRHVPVLMFHTGLHDEYHTPNDDLDKLNYNGIQEVTRLMFHVAWDLANRSEVGPFRVAALSENVAQQRLAEQELAPKPARLGIRWSEKNSDTTGVRVEEVPLNSAAARSGLRVGDRVLKIAGRTISNATNLLAVLLAVQSPAEFVVSREQAKKPFTVRVPLSGKPVRLGIGWRTDDADPGCVILSRVVAGSPAAVAGLRAGDRIYQVDDQEIATVKDLRELVFTGADSLQLTLEREGRMQQVEIPLQQRPEKSSATNHIEKEAKTP